MEPIPDLTNWITNSDWNSNNDISDEIIIEANKRIKDPPCTLVNLIIGRLLEDYSDSKVQEVLFSRGIPIPEAFRQKYGWYDEDCCYNCGLFKAYTRKLNYLYNFKGDYIWCCSTKCVIDQVELGRIVETSDDDEPSYSPPSYEDFMFFRRLFEDSDDD